MQRKRNIVTSVLNRKVTSIRCEMYIARKAKTTQQLTAEQKISVKTASMKVESQPQLTSQVQEQ